MQTAKQIRTIDSRAEALFWIAVSQAQAGQPTQAIQTAKQIQLISQRARAFSRIAGEQAQAEKSEAAKATFAQAVQIAQQIVDAFSCALTLSFIATIQAQVGQDHDALRWARELIDPRDRAYALLSVAVGILAKDKKEETVQEEAE